MSRARDLAALAALVLVVWAVTPFFHALDEDSMAASWLAAANGAERIPALGHLSVWHGRSGAVSPEPAAPLVLARLLGPHLAEPGLVGVLAILAVAWGLAGARIAAGSGVGAVGSFAVTLVASLASLFAAHGRWNVLAAAPLAWIAAELAGRRRAKSLVAASVALVLLSHGGLGIALLLLVVAGLWLGAKRDESAGGAWAAASVVLAGLVAFDEPGWAHLLRYSAAYSFGPDGPYAPETVRPLLAWRLFGPGAASTLASLVLVGGALTAAFRRRSALPAVLMAAGLLTLRLGEPLRFVALVLPPVALHPLPAIAATLVAVISTALLVAAVPRLPLALGFLVLVTGSLVGIARSPERWLPERPIVVALSEVRPGRGIALPLSPSNDLAWRRAAGEGASLANGLQSILERNPGLVASELPRLDPGQRARWLSRLGLDWALTENGVALADDRPRRRARSECLPADGWTFDATRGHAAVSVPERAVDGDPRTRWGTGGPQKRGDRFAVVLPEAVSLRSVELDYAAFPADRPRGFRVSIAGEEGELHPWFTRDPYIGEVVWSEEGFPYFDPRRGSRIRIPLGGESVKKIVIELTRSASRTDWSIAELCLRPVAALHRRASAAP